jgi:hypothetical protein
MSVSEGQASTSTGACRTARVLGCQVLELAKVLDNLAYGQVSELLSGMRVSKRRGVDQSLRAADSWDSQVRRFVSRLLRTLLLLGLACVSIAGACTRDRPVPGFSRGSYWQQPLPRDAPPDPASDEMIAFLHQDHSPDHIVLVGADRGGDWGTPIFSAAEDTPTFSVQNNCAFPQPPEFRSVPIPENARADPTSDAEMTIYDLHRRVVYGFWKTRYDESTEEWSACGGTVYYMDSNGLDGTLPQSDEERNFGHRGLPPTTYAVTYDEIQRGTIDHVLKIAVNTAAVDHVWPMSGSDGDSMDPSAPPEGARLRLKPSIDLSSMELSRPQLTIATAFQEYGVVIGDQSGGPAALKLENTVAEGRGQLWRGLLEEDSLSMFSFEDFEFVKLGYGCRERGDAGRKSPTAACTERNP